MKHILSIYIEEAISEEKLSLLVAWAKRFSPLVTVENSTNGQEAKGYRANAIHMDVSGSLRLFKGQKRLFNRVLKGIRQSTVHASIAMAPTLGCASALAQFCPSESIEARLITRREDIKEALKDLPIQALRISEKTNELLREVNITRIGHLYTITRSALLDRYGLELATRLDQALGFQDEIIEAIKTPSLIKKTFLFSSPVQQRDAITKACSKLLQEIIRELNEKYEKASSLLLALKEEHSTSSLESSLRTPMLIKRIRLSIPSMNEQHLWKLLEQQIEALSLQSPIEQVSLIVAQTEHVRAERLSYFEQAQAPKADARFGEFLDTVIQELGKRKVLQLKTKESHIPEQAFCYREVGGKVLDPSLTQAKRPSVLFYRPHPIAAMALLPDSPPFLVRWKNTRFQIETGIGPERITPEWWAEGEQLPETRDYFRVQLQSGLWLWIYRELETNKWFVHGIWA